MSERERTLTRALALVDEWIGPTGVSAVGAAVWLGGEIVAQRYAGERQPGLPIDERSLFPLASITKPITAAVVMRLVDEGHVSLDESVSRLVPDFAAGPDPEASGVDRSRENLRRTVTVRQLLAHTSGLPEDLGPRQSRYADQVPIGTVVDQMCRLPLQTAPGEQVRYSNAGFAVLSRLVEVATGEPFWTAARRLILDPLDCPDIVANPGPERAERVVRLEDVTHVGTPLETYNGAYWRELALPWGGLFGTPALVVRFAGFFLDRSGGLPVLSAASRLAMTTDHANGVPGGVDSAKVQWRVAHWGLGWEVKGSKRRHWTGDLTSPRTFCHWGHAGTLVWADPDYDVALAIFGNRTVAHLWPFVPPRWARLSNAVVAAVS